jgi:3',5'-cyclic AMP phosphodiesterase CpdA
MRIAQISDLHIGGLFKQSAFDTLVDELNNDIKPDLLIVSGDLTDDGLIFQFEKAREEISRIHCPNQVIFPGNHDYRHTGYLLFEKYFPLSSKNIQEFDNRNIIVVTVNTSQPDRDEGEIGSKQIQWLEQTMSQYGNLADKGLDQTIKIVGMHHHLIAIPDTGYTNVVGISDAGDALRACLESGVDIVMCGHKHRPWMWNLGKLIVLYAGTTCSWRYRGVFEDTYNIIDIINKKIRVDIKTVGGERVPLEEIVERFKEEPRAQVDK